MHSHSPLSADPSPGPAWVRALAHHTPWHSAILLDQPLTDPEAPPDSNGAWTYGGEKGSGNRIQPRVPLPSLDFGANLIAVEHAVSGMPGMMNLVQYLARELPRLPVHFYRREVTFRIVTG